MTSMSAIISIYNKEDQGFSIARNIGTAVVTEKYVILDDVANYIEVDS